MKIYFAFLHWGKKKKKKKKKYFSNLMIQEWEFEGILVLAIMSTRWAADLES